MSHVPYSDDGWYGFIDMYTNPDPNHRSKWEYPYSYDPFWCYQLGNIDEAKDSPYDDRMRGWDYDKFVKCRDEVFGKNQQEFTSFTRAKDTERFLQLYFNNPDLILLGVKEHCNWATGFPCWQFFFK